MKTGSEVWGGWVLMLMTACACVLLCSLTAA